jgi:hypothetical protein
MSGGLMAIKHLHDCKPKQFVATKSIKKKQKR